MILSAKVVGTAIVARLFSLTQPALMRLAWFAKLYGRWVIWKTALLAQVRASWAWRFGRDHEAPRKQRWARLRATTQPAGPRTSLRPCHGPSGYELCYIFDSLFRSL